MKNLAERSIAAPNTGLSPGGMGTSRAPASAKNQCAADARVMQHFVPRSLGLLASSVCWVLAVASMGCAARVHLQPIESIHAETVEPPVLIRSRPAVDDTQPTFEIGEPGREEVPPSVFALGAPNPEKARSHAL
jgi:hypothetical protein